MLEFKNKKDKVDHETFSQGFDKVRSGFCDLEWPLNLIAFHKKLAFLYLISNNKIPNENIICKHESGFLWH